MNEKKKNAALAHEKALALEKQVKFYAKEAEEQKKKTPEEIAEEEYWNTPGEGPAWCWLKSVEDRTKYQTRYPPSVTSKAAKKEFEERNSVLFLQRRKELEEKTKREKAALAEEKLRQRSPFKFYFN